jgi:hypothetical protein
VRCGDQAYSDRVNPRSVRGAANTLPVKLAQRTRPPIAQTVDTGSLRGDFAAIVARFDDRRASEDTAMMRSLMHPAHTTPS